MGKGKKIHEEVFGTSKRDEGKSNAWKSDASVASGTSKDKVTMLISLCGIKVHIGGEAVLMDRQLSMAERRSEELWS